MNESTRLGLVKCVNQYLFRNVWNDPRAEHRQNYKGWLYRQRPYLSVANVDGTLIALPTDDAYYVYGWTKGLISGVNVNCPEWTKASDLMNSKPFDFKFHGKDGEWFHRDDIYLINHPTGKEIIIAVKVRMTRVVVPTTYDFSEFYIGVYYDSDSLNDVEIYPYYINSVSAKQTAYTQSLNATYVIVNGKYTYLSSPSMLNIGDYVEIIIDHNVIGKFDIDFTQAGEARIFESELRAERKMILHIPKALNPLNKVITYNTCDFFIYPKNLPGVVRGGVYMHRCYEDRGLTQLTHNDFALPEPILDAYRNVLDTQEVAMTVLVRNHSKNNTLINETNYLKYLYLLSDKEILDAMEGISNPVMPFWMANHLEQSGYINYMFNSVTVNDSNVLADEIDALGYFETMRIMYPKIRTYTITTVNPSKLEVIFPYGSLITDKVILYKNGIKIPEELYSVSRVGVNGKINFDSSINLMIGDRVTVESNDNLGINAITTIVTPSSSENTFSFDYPVKVYRQHSMIGESWDTNRFNANLFSTSCYTKVSSFGDTVIDEDNGVVTFGTNLYGVTCYIIPDVYCQKVHDETFTVSDIGERTILAIDLQTVQYLDDEGTTIAFPAIDRNMIRVYLNGYELAPGIDYYLDEGTTLSGKLLYTSVYVQNISHIDMEGENRLEIYVSSDLRIDNPQYFTHMGLITEIEALLYYQVRLATLSIGGKVERFVSFYNGYLTIPGDVRYGEIYHVRLGIPPRLKLWFDEYREMEDDWEKLRAVAEFFRLRAAPIEPVEIIHESYHIYCPLLTELLQDIRENSFTLIYDPDAEKMLEQIPDYLKLKDVDVMFQNNPNVTPSYVDFNPFYKWTDIQVEQYRAYRELALEVLPVDDTQDGDNLNGF